MPRGRQPIGEQALSNAERQARYRARREVEQPYDTVAGLVALQAEYAAWHDALPDILRDSATAESLQAIVDLDLDTFIAIVPPRGYGRD